MPCASLLLLGATTWLASWRIRRGLLPLQSLARQAALVSTQSWKLQPPKEAEEIEELRPLTESMTQMLARLEYSFKQQREFVGNAAHELKTPVAVLKSTLQSLLQRPRSSEEYRAGLQASLQDLDRLEQLLQWMLRLARAEQWAQNAQQRELEVIDINSTCEEAVERIRSLAQSRNTTIHLATNGPVPFRADPEDLQLVWTNLLENAVRYSPEGSSVEVAVARARRQGADYFSGPWRRHFRQRSAPHLRSLLSRRPVSDPRHRRFRSGPGHREGAGRSLRRNHRRREHAGKGHPHDRGIAGSLTIAARRLDQRTGGPFQAVFWLEWASSRLFVAVSRLRDKETNRAQTLSSRGSAPLKPKDGLNGPPLGSRRAVDIEKSIEMRPSPGFLPVVFVGDIRSQSDLAVRL